MSCSILLVSLVSSGSGWSGIEGGGGLSLKLGDASTHASVKAAFGSAGGVGGVRHAAAAGRIAIAGGVQRSKVELKMAAQP